MIDDFLSFLDGRRGEGLLIILVVQFSRDEVDVNAALIVDPALHFSNGLLGLFF
jgi:hypothetical protein